MSTRDLGSVTSYAMAVALGFEGTEAEWVTFMMEAGDNAASAAASAASASASATSAEASAETARINYGSPLAASTLSAMTEQNRVYVYTGIEQGMTYGDWYYYDGSGWVDGGVYNATAEGQGLTDNERALILTLFGKAAYAEDDAGDAYDQLSALWSVYSVTWSGTGYTHNNTSVSARGGSTFVSTVTADGGRTISTVVVTMGGVTVQGTYNNGVVTIPNVLGDIVITVTTIQAEVSSISAVYTQGGTVYDTDSLDSLKNDLVVTATYVDQSTSVVPSADYTLSGTLAEGTSTVTVTYGGKTTTFTVTVTHAPISYTITNALTHVTNSNNATTIYELSSYTATLLTDSGYVMSSVSITMGNTDITSTAYDASTKTISIASVTGNIVITATASESAYTTYDTIMANSSYTYNAENSIFFPDYVAAGDIASVDELQFEFEIQLQKTPTSTGTIIGAKSSGDSGDINGLQFLVNSSGLGLYAHKVNVANAYGSFSSVLDLGRHIVKYENTNVSPSTYKCDNDSKSISWTSNGGCTAKLGLSVCNANGTVTQTVTNSTIKIGYVKIWDKDGNLLNHFVPAVRKSDNFVGMYDETNDVFITATTNTRYACGTWTA